MKKLNFEIEDVRLLESGRNSHFSKIKMNIVKAGDNKNHIPIEHDAIEKARKTLVGKPILANFLGYQKKLGGHDSAIPVGFIWNDEDVFFEERADGVWLMGVAYLWNRYFDDILQVFKKQGDKTHVSMEIEVYETDSNRGDKLEWVTDFEFLSVALIGIPPGIENASAEVLQYSQMLSFAQKELGSRYENIDFTIPEKVKRNAQKGLDLHKQFNLGTPVSLANARYLVSNDKSSPEKIKNIFKYFSKHKSDDLGDKNNPNKNYISNLLWGSKDAYFWSQRILDQINEKDESKMSYFEEDNLKNINPEGEWVKEDELEEEKVKETEESSPEKEQEFVESPEAKKEEEKEFAKSEDDKSEQDEEAEEQAEEDEEKAEEDEEDFEKKDEKFSLNAYLDVSAMLGFLQKETEAYKEIADETGNSYEWMAEAEKEEAPDYGKFIAGMYSLMCKMAEKREKELVYAKELESFKAGVEDEKFKAEVKETMSEVSEDLSKEEYKECVVESAKYSLANLDVWKNAVKARAFAHAKVNKPKESFVRVANVWGEVKAEQPKTLWD